MHRFLGPLWPFIVLIRAVGLPQATVLLPGIVALTAFMGLSAIAPGSQEGVRFIYAFVAGLLVTFWRNVPTAYAALDRIEGTAERAHWLFYITLFHLAALILIQSPPLTQRIVTLLAVLRAFRHVKEAFQSDRNTPGNDSAWLLVAAALAIALMNETLIQLVALPVWLVWWTLLPVVWHILSHGLVAAVALGHDAKR